MAMANPSWNRARLWRMRAEEIRALADDMHQADPTAIMLRIARDYDLLAEMAERSTDKLPFEPRRSGS